jgi:glutamate 5-kinase
MITKIKAANMAFNSACDTIIMSGVEENAIKKLMAGEIEYSLFKSDKKKINSRKRWIIDEFNSKGELIINEKAILALKDGASLLSVGVIKVNGKFEEGDNILIKDEKGNHIATGISSYSFSNAKLVTGKNTAEIKEIFGDEVKEELVHRDDLVMHKV